SGPFRVIEADARQTILGRNDSFYRTLPDRTRPYLDRLVLRSYPDTSEALTALGRGEIDGVGGLSTGDAERARGLKNVNLFSFGTNDFTALFLNVRPDKAMFRDRAVRQAIATAIDRGRVLQVAADGRGAVASRPRVARRIKRSGASSTPRSSRRFRPRCRWCSCTSATTSMRRESRCRV